MKNFIYNYRPENLALFISFSVLLSLSISHWKVDILVISLMLLISIWAYCFYLFLIHLEDDKKVYISKIQKEWEISTDQLDILSNLLLEIEIIGSAEKIRNEKIIREINRKTSIYDDEENEDFN